MLKFKNSSLFLAFFIYGLNYYDLLAIDHYRVKDKPKFYKNIKDTLTHDLHLYLEKLLILIFKKFIGHKNL